MSLIAVPVDLPTLGHYFACGLKKSIQAIQAKHSENVRLETLTASRSTVQGWGIAPVGSRICLLARIDGLPEGVGREGSFFNSIFL